MDEQSLHEQEMTPLLATQDSESDQWLPNVMPPGQEMSDFLPKTDPVGQFKIPQTENWEEDTGGVTSTSMALPSPAQPGVVNVGGTPASDTRDPTALPGVCGLINMGNTCYMNAGLQCVYNIPGFCQHFFGEHHLEVPEESPVWMRHQLESQLSLLIKKYWCGQYHSLHPKLFKQVLGAVHPQLNGFRQQDCQEFLALLLGSLQDNHTVTKTSTEQESSRQPGVDVSKPDNESSPQQQDDDTSPQQQTDNMLASSQDDVTGSPQCDMSPSSPPRGDDDTAMETSSPGETTEPPDIVDEFQGSLHNEVVCSVCGYVSTKVEPFLFLSVPLPHAYERQIKMTWIPLSSHGNQYLPVKLLVTVLRNATVATVKEELVKILELIETSVQSIILAEVFSHHIQRVLANDMAIKSLDDNKYELYAIEMMSVGDGSRGNGTSGGGGSHDAQSGSHDPQLGSHDPQPGSHDAQPGSSDAQPGSNDTQHDPQQAGYIPLTSGDTDDITESHPQATAACDEGSGCSSSDGGQGSPPAKLMKSEPVAVVTEWHCCAICLEELLDTELKGHAKCGASICDTCLQASRAHYGDDKMQCPVCSAAVDFDKDFVSLATSETDQSSVIRLLQTNILFRMVDTDNSVKQFGHPRILYLPTPTSGQDLYRTIQQSIPTVQGWGNTLNLYLTDITGCHCSRCDYLVKCTGCMVSSEAPEMLLKPGDHIAITCSREHYDEILNSVSMVTEHSSMATQWEQELTLQDCLRAFSQREELANDNLWYCSRCQGNQPVSRVLSVERLPSTLIIHLKRFVFHGSEGIKVDTPVSFPPELRSCDICHGNDNVGATTLKLVAAVCHFGTMGCGHYTAYSYNTLSDQWHYFNDETVSQKQPDSKIDSPNVYLLFYQTVQASSPLVPQILDIDDFLQQEKSDTEKLSKLFPAPAPFIGPQLPSPAMKKSHSDTNLAAQTKPELGTATSLLNTMDLATSRGFERTTSLLDDYSNYDFDFEDTTRVGDAIVTLSAKPLNIPDYIS